MGLFNRNKKERSIEDIERDIKIEELKAQKRANKQSNKPNPPSMSEMGDKAYRATEKFSSILKRTAIKPVSQKRAGDKIFGMYPDMHSMYGEAANRKKPVKPTRSNNEVTSGILKPNMDAFIGKPRRRML